VILFPLAVDLTGITPIESPGMTGFLFGQPVLADRQLGLVLFFICFPAASWRTWPDIAGLGAD